MIFKDSTKFDSFHFPFNWGVDYTDGKCLAEFDLLKKEKNSFYDIDQSKVNRFGLFGYGLKLFCNKSGSFNLSGQIFDLEYHVNGERYPLTINFENKDFITYKQKEMWFNPDTNYQKDELVSIDFGYKTIQTYGNIQFFFQPIVKLPVNQQDDRVKIEIKLTSNQKLDGRIVIKNNGEFISEIDFPLIENHSSTTEWIIQ